LENNKKIIFKNIYKKYKDIFALKNINYSINNNEFLVIFGPSGAGKTTTLKIIAGLELPTVGEIFINNQPANSMSTFERNVRMTFENYILYPHLTVFENLASPLRVKKISFEEIKRRVIEIADVLGISNYLDRLPRELSGGQKQRVSLGRALIVESDIYLLDEPLAHLDAKIRHKLRAEFQNIKSFLSNSTVIYVTHDYQEALALADRICIIDKGELIQIGNPEEIYNKPTNIFVAEIIGQPQINISKLNISREKDNIYLVNKDLRINLTKKFMPIINSYNKNEIIFGCRPQFWDFKLIEPELSKDFLKGKIIAYEIRNYRGIITVQINDEVINVLCDISREINEKDNIWIQPKEEEILLFDADTNNNLVTKNKEFGDA